MSTANGQDPKGVVGTIRKLLEERGQAQRLASYLNIDSSYLSDVKRFDRKSLRTKTIIRCNHRPTRDLLVRARIYEYKVAIRQLEELLK